MTIYELCYNFNRINTLYNHISNCHQLKTKPKLDGLNKSSDSLNEHSGIDAKRFFLHRVCENVSFIYWKYLKTANKNNEKYWNRPKKHNPIEKFRLQRAKFNV